MSDDIGLIVSNGHQLLAKGQSAWCVLKNYNMAREATRRFSHEHGEIYQYVFPHHTVLKPQPETKRETQRHVFLRFTSYDRDPVTVRGSEAIVWMPVHLPWGPQKDRWLQTQQLMKKWEVKA